MADLNYQIALSAVTDASIGSIFGSMSGQLGQLGSAVRNLDRVMRAAQGVQSLRTRLDELNAEMAAGTRPAEEVQREIDQIRRAMERAENAARDYGIDLNNLDDQLDQMGSAAERARRRMQDLSQIQDLNARGMELLGEAAKTAAVAMVMKQPIADAIEMQSAYTELNRAMNGTEQQFADARKSVEATSQATGIAATEMAALYTAAAQSGAAADELGRVAEQAAKVAVAMDYANPADAAKDFENLKNSLAINRDELSDLADGINYLADQGNAAVKGIVDLTQRVAGIGKAAGLSGLQIAAYGSYVEGLGEPPERAATALSKLFTTLTQGSSMSKSAQKALSGIGLDSENVAKMMQRDATGTIDLVLRKLNQLPKEQQLATIGDIFGTEGASVISGMAQNLDALNAELAKVSNRTKYSGSVQAEFERQSQTTSFQISRLRASLTIASAAIGEAFLPALADLTKAAVNILIPITNFIHENQALVRVVGGLAFAFIGAKVAIISFNAAAVFTKMSVLQTKMFIQTLIATVANLGTTFTRLFTTIKAFAVGQLFTPWGLAIAGVVAATYLLWRYWDRFQAFAKGLWLGMSQALEPLKEAFAPIIDAAQPLFDAFSNFFSSFTTQSKGSRSELEKWTEIGATIGSAIGGALTAVITVLDAIGSTIGWFLGNLVSLFIEPIGTIKNIWSDLASFIASIFVPLPDVVTSVFSAIANIITSAFGGAISYVSGLIDYISGKISSLLSLPSKVTSAVGDAASWVGNKVGGATDWVSRQFGGSEDKKQNSGANVPGPAQQMPIPIYGKDEYSALKMRPVAVMPDPVIAANDPAYGRSDTPLPMPAQSNGPQIYKPEPILQMVPQDNVIPFPAQPQQGTKTTTNNQTNNTTVNAPITINAPPGSNPQDIGQAVSDHLRRAQENSQRQQRAQMVD